MKDLWWCNLSDPELDNNCRIFLTSIVSAGETGCHYKILSDEHKIYIDSLIGACFIKVYYIMGEMFLITTEKGKREVFIEEL